MKTLKYILLSLLGILMFSCEAELEEFEPKAGSADFSVFVALGNSLTAGYADGALYKSAQEVSAAAILAEQLQSVDGGAFHQPLMIDDYGLGGRRILGYSTNCLGVTDLGPIMYSGTFDPASLASIAANGPYQNLGVPGAKVSHLLAPGYGSLNPYFGRFATDPATTSIIQDAMAQNPTFFTLWIGSNDALGYALKGGENPDPTQTEPITNVGEFTTYYGMLVDNLTANGAQGLLVNLGDITSIPFFNTVPYNALVLTDQTLVDMLNAAYGALGFTFQLGPNPLIIQDLNAAGGMRQATAKDKMLLSIPQDSIRCAGWGSLKPVPHNYVLDELEVNNVRNAINAYNLAIEAAANSKGLAYVDMNSVLREAESGILFDGVNFTTTFVTGGVFSLDGVHLNGKGNAIVANYFIEAINAKYGATIPKVVVNDYPGVLFP